MPPGIFPGHRQRLPGSVQGHNLGRGQFGGQRHRQNAAAGADVGSAGALLLPAPSGSDAFQDSLHQQLGLRARDEHGGTDQEIK